MAARKKKDAKTPKKDTIADTIAFVIKGQLTPVKGAATLPDQRVTRKKPEKKKEDLNSSIQKIIKKYAKKFNIKREGARKTRRTVKMAEVKIKEEEVRVKQEPEETPAIKEEEEDKEEEVRKKKRKTSNKLVHLWNGPKRHRVASLNALAKVHCLYENETSNKMTADSLSAVKSDSSDSSDEEQPIKRSLRNVPGLRGVGKHWVDTLSSDSDVDVPPQPIRAKKPKKKPEKPPTMMDLKDMVVQKRMASLNASAILAASYDKPNCSDYDSDSSAERYFACDGDAAAIKKEAVIEQNKMAVIVNQDTDVTITGVYVNRSTRHEGYCSIAGMQYRISATSHTQTASTVATETLLSSSENVSAFLSRFWNFSETVFERF